MADGGEKKEKKGSTRGGSQRKSKSGKRYFKNPWIDEKPSQSGPAPSDEFRGYLIANAERLNQFMQVGLPELPKDLYSVYLGHGGVALTYLRLAHALSDTQNRPPIGAWDIQNLTQKQQQYLGYAEQRLQIALDTIGKLKREDRVVTFLEGEAGVFCVAALLGRLQKKDDVVATYLGKLKGMLELAMGEQSNELLYGKAGYLYALLFALKHVKPDDAELADLAMKVAQQIIKEGRERKFKSMFPLMFEWHDAKYLGGAHGLAGILYTFMQFPALLKDAALVADMQSCVNTLASLERSDGNYPTREDSTKDAELCQWCHGAPSFALLFAKAYELWKNDKVLAAAKRAGECVWRLGLLKKGLGLCHGMGGNGYVFLKLYQLTNEYGWYQRALHYCEFSWSKKGTGTLSTPDRPCSLFEGMGGMMCLMGDCLYPAGATFAGFDL